MGAFTAALRNPFRRPLRQPQALGDQSLLAQALAILRRPGITATAIIPGLGSISGLAANNYLDSAGTTVATVDNPDGLILDGLGSLGSELASTSSATLTGAVGYAAVTLISPPVIGKTYLVTYTYNVSSGVFQVGSGSSFTAGPTHTGPATGTYSYYATGNGVAPSIVVYSNAAVGTVTGLSIREVTGIHASQSTTAAKPGLRRGLKNRALWSNTFSNAAWTGGNYSLTPGISDPYGGSSATTFTATSPGANIQNVAASTSGAALTNGIWIRRRTGSGGVNIVKADGTAFTAQAITSTWTLYVDNRTSAGSSSVGVQLVTTGDEVDIYAALITPGTLTASQILSEGGIPTTTTAAASNPNAGKYWLEFDGGDSLALSRVPFQQADDHAVIAGATPANTTGAFGVFYESGAVGVPIVSGINITAGQPGCYWRNDASTLVNIQGTAVASGEAVILSSRQVSNTKILRQNGVQKGTNSTVLGATTLTAAAIGSDAISSGYMTGSIGPVLIIKGTLSDADMLCLERFVASQTPGAPTF